MIICLMTLICVLVSAVTILALVVFRVMSINSDSELLDWVWINRCKRHEDGTFISWSGPGSSFEKHHQERHKTPNYRDTIRAAMKQGG